MPDKKIIAERLKALRLAKGKTGEEVANALGITQSAWAMYEAGERIPRDEIKVKISKYFKKSVTAIFFTE